MARNGRGVWFTPQERHILSELMKTAHERQKGGTPKTKRMRFNPRRKR